MQGRHLFLLATACHNFSIIRIAGGEELSGDQVPRPCAVISSQTVVGLCTMEHSETRSECAICHVLI